MTSEYTRIAVRCNMHMETKIIDVLNFKEPISDFKSKVKLDLRTFIGQLA